MGPNPQKRKMRYVLAIVGVFLIVGALVFVKFKQISSLIAMGKKMEQAGPPPEAVGTSLAKEETWGGSLTAIGTVAPVQGVTISNDAPGVVTRIHFESGDLVKTGAVLVELDTNVESAQLASAKARKELATQTLERDKKLVAGGVLAGSQLDAEESALKTANADIQGILAQMNRKVVRAPFAGRLGIRTVNVGQFLNPGTALSVLVAVEAVFVDFSLPQQDLVTVTVGMPVHVTVDGNPISVDGTIAALDPTIDSITRSLKARANVPNKEEKLHPGMFANVSVQLPATKPLVTVPITAVVHASYGDSIFVAEEGKNEDGTPAKDAEGKPYKIARQQFVKVGVARGDFIAILDGVKAGDEVVTSGAFKLRNKGKIAIDNKVAPKPELAPKPENH